MLREYQEMFKIAMAIKNKKHRNIMIRLIMREMNQGRAQGIGNGTGSWLATSEDGLALYKEMLKEIGY